jgi:DNA ligase-1
MAELLNAVDSKSAKFITRIPAGKLRLGFSEATILDSLSIMAKKDKSARPIIERAFNVTADIGEVAKIIKKHGVEALEKINPKPGIPIRPSLAERIPDPEEIIKKLGPVVAIEPKLDGFRTAVHIWTSDDKKNVLLFSRNLENMTEMFPEVISSAKKLNVNSIILDGEAIGYDPKSGRFTKFQETIQRKRKYGISEFVKRIPLSVFVFDILYLNGKSLIDEPFSERRKILEKIINKDFGAIKLTEQYLGKSAQDIEKYLIEETKRGLEGIVIKNLNSPYEAGTRGFHWVKFKPTSAALIKLRKEEKTKLADTIDCVVMGAYKGRGKRAEFGVGGFLLGVRGEDNRYYTISKLGSGLSDEDFKEMFKRIKDLKVNSQPKEYVVTKEMIPDIWVKPSLVVEILSDEITLSPRHTAGRKKERGYSLRFPRLVRFREDKNPEDSTSIKEIERMYKIQKKF